MIYQGNQYEPQPITVVEDEHEHLYIYFRTVAKEDRKASMEAGRPIFKDVEEIVIRSPGDRNRSLVAPADACAKRHPETNRPWPYKERFPKHYEAFLAHRQYVGSGTPLSELPFLTEAKRAELRALNIYTAEHLRGLEGPQLKTLGMGGRDLQQAAARWLEKAEGGAVEARLQRENDDLKSRLDALEAMLKEKPVSEPVEEKLEESPFDAMSDEDLKAYLADNGTTPRGNPSRKSLLRMAEEVASKMREAS